MSLKSLQEKIGVGADGAFGPGTMKKGMVIYYKSRDLNYLFNSF